MGETSSSNNRTLLSRRRSWVSLNWNVGGSAADFPRGLLRKIRRKTGHGGLLLISRWELRRREGRPYSARECERVSRHNERANRARSCPRIKKAFQDWLSFARPRFANRARNNHHRRIRGQESSSAGSPQPASSLFTALCPPTSSSVRHRACKPRPPRIA